MSRSARIDGRLKREKDRRPSRALRSRQRPGVEGLESRALLTTILGLTDTGNLLAFDSAAPSTILRSTAITGLASGDSLVGIDINPTTGTLFGLGIQSRIYTINVGTGVASAVGASSFSPTLVGSRFGFDFNPTSTRIRIIDDGGQSYRIDPSTGLVLGIDTAPAYVTGDANDGVSPNIVAVGYTNSVAGASSTTLYAIDAALHVLVQVGSVGGTPDSPNTGRLTTIGSLGFGIDDTVGFDIAGGTNTAYLAVTQNPGSNPNLETLYTVNLATGAATSVGTIGDGTGTLLGLAVTSFNAAGTPTLATASDTGISNTDHLTKIKTPVIQGTAAANAGVQILANGVVVGIGQADATGKYSITLSALADGSYSIVAQQLEVSGIPAAASAPMSPALVIDTVVPATPGAPTLFSSNDTGFSSSDNFTRITTPQFFGTDVSEPNLAVNLYANGILVGQGGEIQTNFYGVQTSRLIDGAYRMTATAVDAAGNVSAMSTATALPLVVETSNRAIPAQAYVAKLYLDLLGRAADQAGLDYYTGIATLPGGRAQVVNALATSTEGRNKIINDAFKVVLRRPVDAASLPVLSNFLKTNTVEQLKAYLAGTGEYFIKAGNTNNGFIDAIYADFLGRPADDIGRRVYLQNLAKGVSRSTIALALLNSPEGHNKTARDLFVQYLGRTPDGATIISLGNILNRGGRDADIVTILTTSNEYFHNARPNDLVIRQFAYQVYRDLLKRDPDAAALNQVVSLFDQGLTPLQVVQTIQNTNEYRIQIIKDLYLSTLRRAADSGGILGGVSALAAGATVGSIRASLIGSDEYFVTVGGNTNTGFVSALYQDVLGRPVDAVGLAGTLAQLNAGVSRTTLAARIIGSLEGVQKTIGNLYAVYIRRPATFTELTSNSSPLLAGTTREQDIVAKIISSTEYFSRL